MSSEEERRRLHKKDFRRYAWIPILVGSSIYTLFWYIAYSTGYKFNLLFYAIAIIEILSVTFLPMIAIDRHFRKKYNVPI